MSKQHIITQLSCILNRGVGQEEDTNYFENKKHDELLTEFRDYLQLHKTYLGAINLENTQALNDKGTDLILTIQDVKVGFQIKSHYDVTEKDFAFSVKRQFTESFSHGLVKWYLLICSPLKYKGKDLQHRISHLVNELSCLQIQYHAIYSPINTI